MSKINAYVDENIAVIFTIVCFIVGMILGFIVSTNSINIQEIKPVDNGYYITINDEIYYKENNNV